MKPFHFQSLTEINQAAGELGVSIPLSETVAQLGESVELYGHRVENRLVIQPMEGCDGTHDGAPDELTLRRYRRFASGGAGLIWAEACAVRPEARANPRQLMLTENNLGAYQAMVEEIREISMRENGFSPVLVLQLTHSGRYSKPEGVPAPLIACHNAAIEAKAPVGDDRILSDDDLKALEENYAVSAALAEKAGFDGVDVKACHRYLISELLSAYNRPGEYGGSFENRTRLYRNAIAAAKSALSGNCFVTTRLNLYDGVAYPDGFGTAPGEGVAPDLTEAIRLVKELRKLGVELVDATIGNPYFNPHVNRPFDQGPYESPESPLVGVARMCGCIGTVKKAVPEMKIICSGVSYLRQFSGNLAAGMLEQGMADLAGFGREAFAYPQFARDLLKKGGMDKNRCCIACGKCTELMRAGSTAGCVVRDEVYLPIYKRDVVK